MSKKKKKGQLSAAETSRVAGGVEHAIRFVHPDERGDAKAVDFEHAGTAPKPPPRPANEPVDRGISSADTKEHENHLSVAVPRPKIPSASVALSPEQVQRRKQQQDVIARYADLQDKSQDEASRYLIEHAGGLLFEKPGALGGVAQWLGITSPTASEGMRAGDCSRLALIVLEAAPVHSELVPLAKQLVAAMQGEVPTGFQPRKRDKNYDYPLAGRENEPYYYLKNPEQAPTGFVWELARSGNIRMLQTLEQYGFDFEAITSIAIRANRDPPAEPVAFWQDVFWSFHRAQVGCFAPAEKRKPPKAGSPLAKAYRQSGNRYAGDDLAIIREPDVYLFRKVQAQLMIRAGLAGDLDAYTRIRGAEYVHDELEAPRRAACG